MTETPSTPTPVLRAPRLLYGLVAASAAALVALGAALGGLDMALGVLLGSVIVGINLLGTVQFVRTVLRGRRYKALLIVSFIVKFGLTMVVLYVAIVRLRMDAIGIVLGLSSVLVAALIYAGVQRSLPNP